MPLFYQESLTISETQMYRHLAKFFRIPSMIVRGKCGRYDDANVHTFRDRKSGNMVCVNDRLGSNKIILTAYHRAANIAQNISKPYILIATEEYDSVLNPLLYESIKKHICSKSDYSEDSFTKIPATKKRIEDLEPNEVTVGRVVSIDTLTTTDGDYYDMRFENNTGAYTCKIDEVMKLTNNPLGKFVVFNNKREVAIYHQNALLRYFDVVEADNQISRPADLFPLV